MENAVPNPCHPSVRAADMNAAATLGIEQKSRDSGAIVQPYRLWSQLCPLRGHQVADATRENDKGIILGRSMRGIFQPRHELLIFRPSRRAWYLEP